MVAPARFKFQLQEILFSFKNKLLRVKLNVIYCDRFKLRCNKYYRLVTIDKQFTLSLFGTATNK